MALTLKLPLRISFPISLDPNPNPAHTHPLPSSELRFSRYDNHDTLNRRRSPNRQEFRRTNKPNADEPSFSAPNGVDPHPAFRFSNIPKSRPKPLRTPPENIKIGDDGISYVIEGAPFEFKYSYTETPKAKPLKIREPPYVPFGPATMPRPWTGRAPLPPSKKKLKEFDSFVLPPPHKKGVKPVQSPGPFLPGTSPRYVHSREEILGEPLTQEEISDLVRSSIKTSRQLNIGRDGLTHNMLDNIHAHWKRRRVCKVKCKGVCTVDMDNVCQQLEEKTGGKVIHRNGGVLYLFRGRNYNYKTRPRFPLMLWKPVPPVYPRLVRRVPEGLTLEQATEMRQKGKQLIPICKLAKNGVYCSLTKTVREAFEECELVRINCQGLNKSDYRKIGAKLRDLVPCTLLSFEEEHILMWRGPNWESSLPNLGDDIKGANNENDKTLLSEVSTPCVQENSAEHTSNLSHDTSISSSSSEVKQSTTVVTNAASLSTTYEAETINSVTVPYGEPEHCVSTSPSMDISDHDTHAKCPSEASSVSRGTEDTIGCESCSDGLSASNSGSDVMLAASDNHINGKIDPNVDNLLDGSEAEDVNPPSMLDAPCMKGVLSLLEQAVEKGSALVLDEDSLDADKIFQTTVAFAKSAPPGPIFTIHKKVVVRKSDKQEGKRSSKTATVFDKKETATVSVSMKGKGEKSYKAPRKKEKFDERLLNVVPQGTLGVDELAKLLT